MPTYPDYVYQTLARARQEGQWYCGQADAAVLCIHPNKPPFEPPAFLDDAEV